MSASEGYAQKERNDTMNTKKYQNTKKRFLSAASFLLIILLFSMTLLPFFTEGQRVFAAGEQAQSGKLLYAGGIPFGVKFFSRGVIIAGFCDIAVSSGAKSNPALSAGLRINDVIVSVDGREPESCEEFLTMIDSSRGEPISIVYEREGRMQSTVLTPVFSSEEGRYKCGMYIRQGGAGIGTVTYIDPETLSFGGLGHGICDSGSGKVLQISHGVVMDVNISGIVKGRTGAPGEIKGSFSSLRVGIVKCNTECGVFGVFSAVPSGVELKKYPIAFRNEVKEGKAYILTTLDESGHTGRYEIEISAINKESKSDNKSFTVKVTDSALIEKSGGIIQGMSGSPIIQEGRLVGAITHVMINDPTVGYGIFIENMLDRAASFVS